MNVWKEIKTNDNTSYHFFFKTPINSLDSVDSVGHMPIKLNKMAKPNNLIRKSIDVLKRKENTSKI